jgi:hypothetical protein
LTSFFLLPVSAAVGLVTIKVVRWYHQQGRMPPRSALQNEAAYANFLARPTFARLDVRAAVGIVLWMVAEGFLLLAPFSFERKISFDKQLEHVVVNTLVNFVQEGIRSARKKYRKGAAVTLPEGRVEII